MPYKYTYEDLRHAGAPELAAGQKYQVQITGDAEGEFTHEPRVMVTLYGTESYKTLFGFTKYYDVELERASRPLSDLDPERAFAVAVDLCALVVSNWEHGKTEQQRLAETRAAVAGEYKRWQRRTPDVGFG